MLVLKNAFNAFASIVVYALRSLLFILPVAFTSYNYEHLWPEVALFIPSSNIL